MTKLKPCPFCGCSPVVRATVEEYAADGKHPAGEYEAWFCVACDWCAIEVGAEYRSEAIENWNRRPKRPTHRVPV